MARAAAPAPAAVPAFRDSTSAGVVDEKRHACIDTYKDSLTPAQVNEYCATGGILYGD